ncbi:CHAT domain-containing protein [Streptomyces sp. NPDC001816]|uniref:CHAT domain-containing protein n=1 Tax=Streptomyces sp. NPDC001816 TaxID=3364612 RepID=UPI0036AB46B7
MIGHEPRLTVQASSGITAETTGAMVRHVLLERIRERVRMAEAGAAAEAVLSREGLADAAALLARHRSSGVDLAALKVCGMLFFHRALRQRRGSHSAARDSAAAGHLFAAVHVLSPGELPSRFNDMYRKLDVDPHTLFSEDTGFTTDPLVWWDLGFEVLRSDPQSMAVPHLTLVADLFRLARLSATPDHLLYPDLIPMLGTRLCLLRSATQDTNVAAEAFEVCGTALDLLAENHPQRPLFLRNHGVEATVLAQRLDDVDAARTAVARWREIVRLPDTDSRDRLSLGAALAECARLTENEQQYLEALRTFWQLAHSSSEPRMTAFNNLKALLGRLLQDPQYRDIVSAFCRSALPAPGRETFADGPVLGALWSLESMANQNEHDLRALTSMVTLARRMLAVAEDDNSWREAAIAAATALHQHAQLIHSADEAREAIALAQTGLDITERLDSSQAFIFRHALASANGVLYEVTGDPEAQREAVRQGQLSVDSMDGANAVQQATALATYAGVLHRYAARMADRPLLHEALALQQRASSIRELPSYLRTTLLCGLAGMLTDLHVLEKPEAPDNLRQAVAAAEQALSLAEPGIGRHGQFARQELLHAKRLLGVATNNPEELRSVVVLADEILATDGEELVKGIVHAVELERAQALGSLARMGNSPQHRRAAFAGLDRVMDSTETRPWLRMQAAVVQLQMSDHDDRESLDRIAKAVDLLQLNVASGALWDDREHVVRTFAVLTEEIVLTGLSTNEPVRTVELLERSRGLLLQDDLSTRFRPGPEYAGFEAEVKALSDRLRALDARDRAASGRWDERRELNRGIADERAQLMGEWNRLRALLPREDSVDLAHLASGGPVVKVVSTSEGGHAFLLTGDPTEPVQVLQLPELDTTTAHDRVLTFLTAREYATESRFPGRVRLLAQAEVRDTLAWLWQVAAQPIVEALGLTSTPEGTWPRMWWCPVGFLGHLPWHAAQSAQGDGVLDRVVSSYTTSLRSLHFARRIPTPPHGERALIVAQPEVPSAEPLRGVEREVAVVRRFVPQSTLLEKSDATKDNVLNALQSHSIVHLACHADSDVHSPGRSRLLLVDHEESPLTVADLAGMPLAERQLAVLSACSTFQITPALADEALHVTAAFQQAGFRHVVGAMWPVGDDVATAVSGRFYDRLTGSAAHPPQTDLAAMALHDAVSLLRRQYSAAPTKWASFIHLGA